MGEHNEYLLHFENLAHAPIPVRATNRAEAFEIGVDQTGHSVERAVRADEGAQLDQFDDSDFYTKENVYK